MDLQQEIIATRGMLDEASATQARLLRDATAARALWERLDTALNDFGVAASSEVRGVLGKVVEDLFANTRALKGEVWFLFKEEQKAADLEDRLARRLDSLKAQQEALNDLSMAFHDAAEEMGVR